MFDGLRHEMANKQVKAKVGEDNILQETTYTNKPLLESDEED